MRPFSIPSFRVRHQGWLGARQGSTSFHPVVGSTNASQQLCKLIDLWVAVEQIDLRKKWRQQVGRWWVVLPKGTEKLVVPSKALPPSLGVGGMLVI